MYDAFVLNKLVDKLPLKICALATWSNWFMISTVSDKNEAHLLVYQMKLSDYHEYIASLSKTLKKFTSKPIKQLAVIPEYKIFLGLSDSEVFYADLDTFIILGHIARSRGTFHFAIDWQKLQGQVGYNRELRVCLATKKKLQLYEWSRNTFIIIKSDLNFPDTPRSMAWVGDNLIICIKKDLFHISMEGESRELFSIGVTRTEPCLYPMMNGEIVVLQDERQVSLDSNAKPTQTQSINWSDLPSAVEHVHPYIVALLPKGIEVRAYEQKIHVQSIRPFTAIKFIASSKSTLIASHSDIFKLEPRAYDAQVLSCIEQKQFELALSIAELVDEQPSEAKRRRAGIVRRFAFHQFTQFKFEESLKHYLEIQENPMNVIGLYPNLVPSDHRNRIMEHHPTKPPTLTGDDLDEGMKHLTTYLTQMRYQCVQLLQRHQKAEKGEESPEDLLHVMELKTSRDSLQLIDTTLLKCYIKAGKKTMIGSLVRLPDNYLHLVECERVLRKENHFQELIDLYQSKGKHKNALQLLHQFSSGPNGPLMGVAPTIIYLHNLGEEYLDLILENSKWVFEMSEADALHIFTEDVLEVKSLPREKVMDHLSKNAPNYVIPYLEHIIKVWGEEESLFHNKLVKLYQQGVEALLPEYKKAIEHRQRAKAGEEPGELGILRSKLLIFLRQSHHYKAVEHISSLPQGDLFEERALLLSRLDRHEVALAIYVHILKEPEMAEEYCRTNCDPDKDQNRDVYLCLMNMYLCPPNLASYGIDLPYSELPPEPNVKAALDVLTSHHHMMDTTKVLEQLPSGIRMCDIYQFLGTVVLERTRQRRRTQLMRSLLRAENLQVKQMKFRTQSPFLVIGDNDVCEACGKRLGTSAFVRYPNGSIEHYYCAKENLTRSVSSLCQTTSTAHQETPLVGSTTLGVPPIGSVAGSGWTPPPGDNYAKNWSDLSEHIPHGNNIV